MMSCRVRFERLIWDVPFSVGEITIRRARDRERARRAAELRFARARGGDDWRPYADRVEIAPDDLS